MRRATSIVPRALILRSNTLPFRQRPTPRHMSTAPPPLPASPDLPPLPDLPPSPASLFPPASTADTASGIIPTVSDGLVAAYDTLSLSGALFGWVPMLSLTALAARAATSPFLYHASHHQPLAALASPEIRRVQAYLKTAPGSLAHKWITFRRLRAVALRSAGTSPAHLYPWFPAANAAALITASLAVRRIAAAPPDAWATAGPGAPWFLDLAAPDPTGVLPIAATALWLYTAHGRTAAAAVAGRGSAAGGGTASPADAFGGGAGEKRRKDGGGGGGASLFDGEAMTIGLQALPLFAFPFVQQAPAGMFVLWITSSLLTAAQRAALRSDAVRRAIGLPTREELQLAARGPGPTVLKAANDAVRDIRAQLEYVQAEVLPRFADRAERGCGEELRKEVEAALARAKRTGKISIDLGAVVRVDEDTGREYMGVVRKGKK